MPGAGVLSGGLLLAAGCASPGRPLPPSLRLPAPVTDLRAERVGDAVELRWTTPAAATDGVALKGAVSTEICRDVAQAAGGGAACTVVRRESEAQGATAAVDALPAALMVEPAGALMYRVRLLNAAGHDAGLSNAAFAASGQAPAVASGVQVSSDVHGVRLQWAAAAGPEAAMEIRREELGRANAAGLPGGGGAGVADPAVAGHATGGHGAIRRGAGARGADPEAQLLMVDAGGADPGGAIDATATRDESYRYALTRVRTVRVAGQSLTLRGPESTAVVIAVKDLAAPATPKELVAAADGLKVSLSWEPDFEADLAGYRVYRAAGGVSSDWTPGMVETPGAAGTAWVRLNVRPITTPGFADVVPQAGEFRYRVTAVDGSGNESAAGEAVMVRAIAEAAGQP